MTSARLRLSLFASHIDHDNPNQDYPIMTDLNVMKWPISPRVATAFFGRIGAFRFFRSSPRKRGPSPLAKNWMPAFAGMSGACVKVDGNRPSLTAS